MKSLLTSQMDVYSVELLQDHKIVMEVHSWSFDVPLEALPMTVDTSFLFQVGLSANVLS